MRWCIVRNDGHTGTGYGVLLLHLLQEHKTLSLQLVTQLFCTSVPNGLDLKFPPNYITVKDNKKVCCILPNRWYDTLL